MHSAQPRKLLDVVVLRLYRVEVCLHSRRWHLRRLLGKLLRPLHVVFVAHRPRRRQAGVRIICASRLLADGPLHVLQCFSLFVDCQGRLLLRPLLHPVRVQRVLGYLGDLRRFGRRAVRRQALRVPLPADIALELARIFDAMRANFGPLPLRVVVQVAVRHFEEAIHVLRIVALVLAGEQDFGLVQIVDLDLYDRHWRDNGSLGPADLLRDYSSLSGVQF